MPKFTVHVPDSNDRRLMTSAQWLQEFMVHPRGERSRVFTLPSPVRLAWIDSDDRSRGKKTCRTSTTLFRQLQLVAHERAVLTSVTWQGAKLGKAGLHVLNTALSTPTRAGGSKNLVRAFLEDRQGPSTPLRCDWPALLAYLEIRPVFTRKTVSPAPAEKSTTTTLA